ncbi:hypothetical protein CEXT_282251, partial [Caerostris extrusa]
IQTLQELPTKLERDYESVRMNAEKGLHSKTRIGENLLSSNKITRLILSLLGTKKTMPPIGEPTITTPNNTILPQTTDRRKPQPLT